MRHLLKMFLYLTLLSTLKLVDSYRAILDRTDTQSSAVGGNSYHSRSSSFSGAQSGPVTLTPEAMDRMIQNATFGVQMLDAALRQIGGPSAVSQSLQPGGSTGPGPLQTLTSAPPPPASAASTTSSTSNATVNGANTNNNMQPMQYKTIASPSPKMEEMRIVEDGPTARSSGKMESKAGKDGANGTGGGGSAKRQVGFLTLLFPRERRPNAAARYFLCPLTLRFPQKMSDDAPSDGQTCLGCKATSTPEWRRGPMGKCCTANVSVHVVTSG